MVWGMKRGFLVMFVLCTAIGFAHSVAPPFVVVGGSIAKPGPYELVAERESVAELINRIGGVPITEEEAKDYAAGKVLETVDLVMTRKDEEEVFKFGEDEAIMRKIIIQQGDAFNVRRGERIFEIATPHTLTIKVQDD